MQWGDNALSAPTTPSNRLPRVDRSKADPQHVRVAEWMEAMFVNLMMKSMRDTVPETEGGLHNAGTRLYQGMLDSETAQKVAQVGGMGLADQVIAYLEAQRYNSNREQAVPVGSPNPAKPSTGGIR